MQRRNTKPTEASENVRLTREMELNHHPKPLPATFFAQVVIRHVLFFGLNSL